MAANPNIPPVELAEQLAVQNDRKIVLAILDGLGGVPRERKTELEAASIPNLNRLAAQSSLGLSTPIAPGITPGSGPAHLALFGYDPVTYRVPRGVLEGMGLGLELAPGDLVGRGNFATIDDAGRLVDRRAGRLPTAVCALLCGRLQREIPAVGDVRVTVVPGAEHRFVVLFRGPRLAGDLSDSDPQHNGERPLEVLPPDTAGARSAEVANTFIRRSAEVLASEKTANWVLLRGLGSPPAIPSLADRYRLRPVGIAAYPMYRGIARLCGMDVPDAGSTWESELDTLRRIADEHDFCYIHFKETDRAGEDGDFDAKVEIIERFDEEVVPRLVALRADVLCITGDHSTPAVLCGHSWHPVPLLIHASYSRRHSRLDEFGERACARGDLGHIRARDVMPLLLAYGLKLRKFGA